MLAVVDTPPALHVTHPRGIQNVLIAFDGTPGAWIALARAIDVAVSQHARLLIAGVVREPSFWFSIGGSVTPFSRESLIHDLKREMQQSLAAARDEIPATVSVTTHLLHGRPAAAIAALADA